MTEPTTKEQDAELVHAAVQVPDREDWTPLCRTADVPADGGKRVEIAESAPVAIFRLEDGYFVIDDTCSHGEASLCDGYVDGGEVECPWHSGKFDIRTGAATCFPAVEPIRVHRCRVVDGEILIPKSQTPRSQ